MALSNVLRRRRGTANEHQTFVGDVGEITVDTTYWCLHVHDGTTMGGHIIPTIATVNQYLEENRIGYDKLTDELKAEIDKIDTMLTKTEAEATYRKKSDKIDLGELGDTVNNRLNTMDQNLLDYKADMLNTAKDEAKGSKLVGYIANTNGFGAQYENINTVKDAIDNLGERVSYNEGQNAIITSEIALIRQSNNAMNDRVDGFNTRLNTIEPKVETLRTEMTNANTNITNIQSELQTVDNRIRNYTDGRITEVNARIDTTNTNLTALDNDVYRKATIDGFNTAFTNKDTQLQTDLTSVTNRVTIIEGNRYTKTEVDNEIDTKLAALVNSAPTTLDTLKELADALGNDANFATTMTEKLALKADKDTFDTLNNTVTNEESGLVYRTGLLESGLKDTQDRTTVVEKWLNGTYDNKGELVSPGLIERMDTVESSLGIGGQSTLQQIKDRLDVLEQTVLGHGNVLNGLHEVAYSGRYDKLIGTPIIPKGYYTGENVFNGKTGKRITVPANFQSVGAGYRVLISPKSDPHGTIGEVWIVKADSYFTVYCSGASTTTKFDYVIFNNDARIIDSENQTTGVNN